jgi:hypothetical protein
MRRQNEITGDVHEQEVAIVGLESVMRPSPEVRAAVGLDHQSSVTRSD